MTNSSDDLNFKHEWPAVHERRVNAFGGEGASDAADKEKRPRDLVGLALSGGGVRSAFFNLGFLQALSHRGLLRYVDYMCSVSGGGYIAGYLTSLAAKLEKAEAEKPPAKNSPKGFHTDDATLKRNDHGVNAGYESSREHRAWHLGRHPITGEIDGSLPGIGAYLTRTGLFVTSFLVSFLIRMFFYGGLMGVVATCVALFYRTFDHPMFRVLCDTVLDMNYGNELMKAFMPSFALAIPLGILSISCLFFRHPDHLRHLDEGGDSAQNRKSWYAMSRNRDFVERLRRLQRCFLWLFGLSLLCGVAIFAGNDITNVRKHATGQLSLNHYAEWVILLAALSQVIAFLGRDRLFKSEQNENRRFPGVFQSVFTAGIVIFSFLTFVHSMGREDISGYTRNRDPHLVRGDVLSWRGLQELSSIIEPGQRPLVVRGNSLEVRDRASDDLRLPSEWSQHTQGLFTDQVGLRHFRSSQPQSPFEALGNSQANVTFFQRVFLVADSWIYGLSRWGFSAHTRNAGKDIEKLWKEQDDLLFGLNRLLEKETTFSTLCSFTPDGKNADHAGSEGPALIAAFNILNVQSSAKTEDSSNDQEVQSQNLRAFQKWVMANQETLSENDLGVLIAQITVMNNTSGALAADGKPLPPISDRVRITTASRILLEQFFPRLVQSRHVASTFVVPPHDQAARRTWLIFWMACAVAGTLLGSFSLLVSAPRYFYRTQLDKHFLGWQGDRGLSQLQPQSVGLPLPIFLASHMRRVLHRGRVYVEHRPHRFVTTKSDSAKNGTIQTDSHSEFREAVALSGAAVTPLMTQNIWLSLLLDFFGTGLGGWPGPIPVSTANRVLRFRSSVPRFFVGVIISYFLFSSSIDLQTFFLWPFVLVILILSISEGPVNLFKKYVLTLNWVSHSVALGMMAAASLHWWSEYNPAACTTALVVFIAFLRSWQEAEESFFKLLTPMLIRPTQAQVARKNPSNDVDRSVSPYVADGGFYDYLGVTELLRRRCELMVVSDAGAHLNQDSFATLAKICETARSELGVQFLDLDHSAPIDFRRLQQDKDKPGLVDQTFLAIRVRYPEARDEQFAPAATEAEKDGNVDKHKSDSPREGLLFYCQMGITERDPVEILQIRNRFPSFPDEPTTNQFYTDEQVAAYRNLGYHLGNSLCSELHRWNDDLYLNEATSGQIPQIDDSSQNPTVHQRRWKILDSGSAALKIGSYEISSAKLPGYEIIKDRLLTSYRLACHREVTFKKGDVREEAIWPGAEVRFPTLRRAADILISDSEKPGMPFATWNKRRAQQEAIVKRWLTEYEQNADLRAAFRCVVLEDINLLDSPANSWCHTLFTRYIIHDIKLQNRTLVHSLDGLTVRVAAFLSTVAVASHEIHSGLPHETFQVGGREKLVSLSLDVAEEVSAWLVPDRGTDTAETQPTANRLDTPSNVAARDLIGRVIGEVMELTSQIFYKFEHRTVASFSVCFIACMSALRTTQSSAPAPDDKTHDEVGAARPTEVVNDNNVQLLTMQARILRALRRNDPKDLSMSLLSFYKTCSPFESGNGRGQ